MDEPTAPAIAPEPDVRFCAHCGANRPEAAAFCPACGAPYATTAATPAPPVSAGPTGGWVQAPQPSTKTNWVPVIVICVVAVVVVVLVISYFAAEGQVQVILQQVGASV